MCRAVLLFSFVLQLWQEGIALTSPRYEGDIAVAIEPVLSSHNQGKLTHNIRIQESNESQGFALNSLSGFPKDKHLKAYMPLHRLDPLYIHSAGCTGSSIILDIARDILELHGVNAYMHAPNMPEELVIPKKNPFYTPQRGIGTAMKILAQAAKANGTTLLFKSGGIDPHLFEEVAPALLNIKTKIVYLERTNLLDYMTCRARDCFEEETIGYPVDAFGQKSEMCFERRKLEEKGKTATTTVFFNVDNLIPELEKLQERSVQQWPARHLADFGFQNVTTVSTERLLKYETKQEDGLEASVKEWIRLFSGWRIEASEQLIRSYLLPYVGTHPMRSQKQGIYNWPEVHDAVAVHPNLRHFLGMMA